MRFKLLKNKDKIQENTVLKIQKNNKKTQENNLISNSNINEETRRKFILKGWIELNRKTTCTKKGTRGFLFGSQTPSKMDFAMQSISGRSMVEMLGVLAIVGVLSIGGISGYTIAMRRYQANEILNIVNKYALLLYSNCQQAMLNDSDYYIDEHSEWICPDAIDFDKSGLGGLPKGAQKIESSYIWYPAYGGQHLYIHSKDSGDLIGIKVSFDSKELCKVVQQMTGSKYDYENKDYCEEEMTAGDKTPNALVVVQMN